MAAKVNHAPTEKHDKRKRPAPVRGTAVIWPAGVEERYGISPVTRWRWEKKGSLPKRDVSIGGRTGWRPETLDTADRGASL